MLDKLENNNKERILIVTHWFYPRQIPRAFRALELYKQLKKSYEVDVVIGDWKVFLSNGDDYEEVLKRFSNDDKKNAILSNYKLIQKLKAVLEFFVGERYYVTSGKFVKKHMELYAYKAVISIGLPFYIHWITSDAIRKYKKNDGRIIGISDWGDPFVGQTQKKIAPYFENIQRKVCQTFDYIVTPTEQAMTYYEKYTTHEKIKIIPQGIDFEEIRVAEKKKNEVIHFAYAGIFYEDIRNPKELFEYLCSIKNDFVFTIYTIKHGSIYQDILLKYSQKLQDKLVIKDMIPRMECIYELSKNDFLINIENETSTQIPSKLIDYSLTKRPILSFKQNEIPTDKFGEFLNENYSQSIVIDVDQFDTRIVTKKFERLIKGE